MRCTWASWATREEIKLRIIHGCGRYGICLAVVHLISHKWAQLTPEILRWTREEKFHIYKQPCIILFIYIDILITAFWRFTEDLRRLSESSPKASQTFPKISEKEPTMFRSYGNTSKYFLRNYITIAMVIFQLEEKTCYFHVCNNMLFARVRISC